GLFMSLDGVIEAPDQWSLQYMNEEAGQAVGQLIAGGDTLLLGRKTYEIFSQSFGAHPSDDAMAAQMNAVPKVVVSTTLARVDWQNSTLVNDDVAAAITRLKQQPGANIN